MEDYENIDKTLLRRRKAREAALAPTATNSTERRLPLRKIFKTAMAAGVLVLGATVAVDVFADKINLSGLEVGETLSLIWGAVLMPPILKDYETNHSPQPTVSSE